MFSTSAKNNHSSGFIGIVFLAIALITIVVGAIASMSRQSSADTRYEAAKAQAAMIIKQSTDLRRAYEALEVDMSNPASVSLSSLYAGKYAIRQYPPVAAFISNPPYGSDWMGHGFIYVPTVVTGAAKNTVVLDTLTKEVCQAINFTLYKDSITANPPVSGNPAVNFWPGGPGGAGIPASPSGRVNGCVTTSDGYYAYYHIMVE